MPHPSDFTCKSHPVPIWYICHKHLSPRHCHHLHRTLEESLNCHVSFLFINVLWYLNEIFLKIPTLGDWGANIIPHGICRSVWKFILTVSSVPYFVCLMDSKIHLEFRFFPSQLLSSFTCATVIRDIVPFQYFFSSTSTQSLYVNFYRSLE